MSAAIALHATLDRGARRPGMKFYIEFCPVDGLDYESQTRVMILRLAMWQVVRCRTLAEDTLRDIMYDKVELLPAQERQKYLREVYEPNLQKIGSDGEVISRIKRTALAMGFDVTTERGKLTVSTRDDRLTDVAVIIHGDDAFAELTPPSPFCKRAVYVNRATREHYVKDNLGVLTRRYAYRSGNRGQWNAFRTSGTSRKPTDKDLSSPISAPVMGSHQLVNPNPTLEQAIYIHQRYGSGEEQRGVCLSTTPHCIVSDQGFSFGGGEPVRYSVDLARVPPGTPLYNLYENPSQWIGLDYYRYNKKGPRTLTYVAEETRKALILSMLKNTELFLETLLLTQVADVYEWSAVDGVWRLLYHHYDPTAPRPSLAQEPPPAIHDGENVGSLDRR
jgi:hypothetical protein